MRKTSIMFHVNLAYVFCSFLCQSRPLPDADSLMISVRTNLTGDFLMHPITRNGREYRCDVEDTYNELDRKGRATKIGIIKTYLNQGSCLIGMDEGELGESPLVEIRDQIWDMIRLEMIGREKVDGRDAIAFSFETPSKSSSDYVAKHLKYMLKTRGRLWIDEDDRKLIKVEGEYTGGTVLVAGLISSFGTHKGDKWAWELVRMNDGAWLPAYVDNRRIFSTYLWRKREWYKQNLLRYSNYSLRDAHLLRK